MPDPDIQNAVIRHALRDQTGQVGAARDEQGPSLLGRFMDWIRHNHARQPKLTAQLEALGREARKDINATLQQVFFGQQPSFGEPGTPLVPTQAQVTKALGNVHGYATMLEDAAARGVQRDQQKGLER
jgi:hypothetical protein